MAEIYEVKLFSEYGGVQCLNVFHYLLAGTIEQVSGSLGLAVAMGFVEGEVPVTDDLYGRIKTVVNVAVTYSEVQVRAVYDVLDFYVQPLVVGNLGLTVGTGTTPALAWGFQTNRVTQAIRRGSKRLVGATSDQIMGGGELSTDIMTANQLAAVAMSLPLEYDDDGNTIIYTPMIVSKELYVTPQGNNAYRYYDTEVEQLLHLAVGITYFAQPYVRTQVSRQYGRGQ